MIRILKRLFQMMAKYKKRLYLGIVLSMINNILGIVPVMCGVWVIKTILDDINGTAALNQNFIFILIGIIVGTILLRWLFAYIRATKQDSVAHEFTTNERLKIGDVLKRVSLGFLQRKNMGEITTAITTDLAFFEVQAMNVINNIVDSYIFLFMTIIFMFSISPTIGLSALIAVIISSIGLQLIEYQSRKNSPIRQESINEMADEIVQYVRGMAVVKSFKQEGIASEGLYKSYKKSKDINIRMEKNFAPCDALHRFGLYMGTSTITILTALMALHGNMELHMALMLIVYSYVMFNTIEAANSSLHILEILDTIAEKLQSIVNAEFIDKDGKDILISNFDIEFNDVSFAYESREVLSHVSFTIPENTMTAIVGPSCSGKTKICSLLARFYDVKKGYINIGGKNIKDFTCDSLLKNISMVFQNVYLFHDTIRNNILFGDPNATEEEMIAAAKSARCHDFIMELPLGYDTLIGEGGSTLSGGEKQGISIARAILKNAPIVILDEATSSVDPENEHLIQQAISNLTHGKTIIVIAHRLATIENANQILVVDEGKIAQRGTHEQLSVQEGIYKRFTDIREKAEGWTIGSLA
ncbi:ABC transporter ATP-binding protein [Peptoniphilus sp. SGI.035]|uniref:ABC transporter ATP-binding protein n=1 Tax=Peptoniphilus sp. SGI.035 TaxID=3420564 RepID=UPI003D03267E